MGFIMFEYLFFNLPQFTLRELLILGFHIFGGSGADEKYEKADMLLSMLID